jgi:protein-disulfide isomerase
MPPMKPVARTGTPMRTAIYLVIALAAGVLPEIRGVAADPSDAIDPRLGSPFVLRDRPVYGSDKAPIVMVEVISYKCAHCRAYLERVYPEIKRQYVDTGKVQVMMINASDDPAESSAKIFAVGRCLNQQGKLWSQMDFMFQIASKPSSFLDDLIAQNPEINSDDLAVCLQDRVTRQKVAGDFAEYQRIEVKGTPAFFINRLNAKGQRTETRADGYEGFEYFQQVFDALLKQD